MGKIVFTGVLVCLSFTIFISSANAADNKQQESTLQSSHGSSSGETHPYGSKVTSTGIYRPKPKKGESSNICNDQGDTWRLHTNDDIVEEVAQFNSTRLIDLVTRRENVEVNPINRGEPGLFGSAIQQLVDYTLGSGAGNRVHSETGRWWQCGTGRALIYPEDGLVNVTALIYQSIAEANPGLPEYGISPDFGHTYAQMDVIFGIEDDYWKPVTATASAGRISTTATLTPIRSIWDSGQPNKQPVVCNQGEIRVAGDSKTWYPCMFTYTRSTPIDEPYDLTIRVEFEVEITSTLGDLGEFPNLTLSTSEPIEVREIHGLNVPTR